MSAYTEHSGPIHVGGRVYELTSDLVWCLGKPDSGFVYTVPAGYRFDVSVPWLLTWLIDPHDASLLKAAALHDHMLENGWNRVESAGPFERALAADGVPWWRRLLMFLGVALYQYR